MPSPPHDPLERIDMSPRTSTGQTPPSSEPAYGTRAILENSLERWPNPEQEQRYRVTLSFPEFTCLCPRSGYPDFATIRIVYDPEAFIVELKSLKLYLNGFRDQRISHEGSVNRIFRNLVTLLAPRFLEVTGDFNVRGNLKTVITIDTEMNMGRPNRRSSRKTPSD